MTYKNKTYRNVTITSILSIIMITSGIGLAYAADFPGSNTFGYSNTVSGSNSAAFGAHHTVSGDSSNAFGIGNTVSGHESAGFGVGTTTSARHSVAFGHYTTAQSSESFVIGRCNEISGTPGSWISTEPLFVIGNGDYSPDSCITTNNIVTVYKNGTALFDGKVVIGTSSSTQPLQVNGIIESTTSGFKFPDGTIQTSASGTTTLQTSSGIPTTSCTSNEIGSMKIDSSRPYLYVCSSDGWKLIILN